MKKSVLILMILTIVSFFAACNDSQSTGAARPVETNKPTQTKSEHVALGVPKDADSSDDYIVTRKQYVLSYNYKHNTCNWVSWELDKNWYGDAGRYSGQFITDKTLPEKYYHVDHEDYTNSGYDRGHMVRSEERTDNEEDNKSTFYLSNILPQTPDLNRGVWLNLEYYCEKLCKEENKKLYVIAGGVFHSSKSIGNGVSVPDSCFKIIVVMNPGDTFSNVTASTRVIAVMMPNIDGIRKDKWEKYVTTVDQIEASTGYDFLSNVPVGVQKVIESRK